MLARLRNRDIVAGHVPSATTTVDYSQALHDAKRWVRNQEKWRSPHYWATFTLIGPK
jgi:CHAT domain-containing protein